MAGEQAFGRKEKLKSRKGVEALFAKGKTGSVFPIRYYYQYHSGAEASGLQVGVTVSKKHFKKAVDRNRIKRLLREAYRLQKGGLLSLLQQKGLSGNVFFIYVDKTLPPFSVIFEAMTKCLEGLAKKAQQHESTG